MRGATLSVGLNEAEIRKGKSVQPLEFGDLVFKGLIKDPLLSVSGTLMYGYQHGRIVWTEFANFPKQEILINPLGISSY